MMGEEMRAANDDTAQVLKRGGPHAITSKLVGTESIQPGYNDTSLVYCNDTIIEQRTL